MLTHPCRRVCAHMPRARTSSPIDTRQQSSPLHMRGKLPTASATLVRTSSAGQTKGLRGRQRRFFREAQNRDHATPHRTAQRHSAKHVFVTSLQDSTETIHRHKQPQTQTTPPVPICPPSPLPPLPDPQMDPGACFSFPKNPEMGPWALFFFLSVPQVEENTV